MICYWRDNIEEGALPDDYGLYHSLSDYMFILSMRELRELVYLRSNVLGDGYYAGKTTKRLSDAMSSKGIKNWIPQYWMRLPLLNTDTMVEIIGPKLEKENINIFITVSNCDEIGVRPACRLNSAKLDIAYGEGSLDDPYVIVSGDGLMPVNLNKISNENVISSDFENEAKDTSMSSWAEKEIKNAIDANLIPLDMRSNYKRNITREEFDRLCLACIELSTGKQVIDFMKENDIPMIQTPFRDSNSFSLLCGRALGIISGYNNYVDPKDFITREQAAVMLMNLGKALNCPINTSIDTNYTDNDSISPWARDGVKFVSNSIDPASNLPIMLGSNNIFNPGGYYTREQAYMTVLKVYRFSVESSGMQHLFDVPTKISDSQQKRLVINGTISLPGNDIAPPGGLMIYVGCHPVDNGNINWPYYGSTFFIEAGKNKIKYSFQVDEEYRNYTEFIVKACIPNFLDDGSKYKKTPYSDLDFYYSSKGTTTIFGYAETVDLKYGVAYNIDFTLQRNTDIEAPQ